MNPHRFGGVFDPNFANVSLLLQMNGSAGSTTFTDSGPLALVGTANGNAQLSTTQVKYGSAAGAFDGTGDYISYAAHAGFGFGTGDFTIEDWVYFNALGADRALADFRSANGNDVGTFFVDGSNNKLAFWYGALLGSTGNALSINTWYYLTLKRTSGVFSAAIDGVEQWNATPAAINFGATRPLGIGGAVFSGGAGSSPLNGYVGAIRITKGVARDVSVVPTAAFPSA